MIHFHGGCVGCTRQEIEPQKVLFCVNCQYFDADRNLPDLNNRPLTQAEIVRAAIKKRLRKKPIALLEGLKEENNE